MTAPPEFLTNQDLADMFRVSLKAVRQWRHAGVGPPGFKIGGGVRYARADVAAWVEAQRTADRVLGRTEAG